jgi:anaerobic magnesium-protoporphyrin IX monomethyl ester cyclase
MSDHKPTVLLTTIHAGFHHSSLALASLKAALIHSQIDIRIPVLEFSHQTPTTSKLEQILELQPDVIGFSTYLWNIKESIHLSNLIKKVSPKTTIVFGGPEAGPEGKKLLKAHSAIDYVIKGEGEDSFRDLLQVLFSEEKRKSSVSGLHWRTEDGNIHLNPVQLINPASLISPFSLDLHQSEKHLLYWETSRGCPFQCTFCTSSQEKIRAFPLERVEEDLKRLTGIKNKTIKLLDRSFHFNTKRALSVLEMVEKWIDPDNTIHLEINPDRMSDELFAFFEKAPVHRYQFEIGLQTLNENCLQLISRKMDIPLALENIQKLMNMKNAHIHLDLIAGLPGDKIDDFFKSLDRTFLLHAHHLQLGTLKMLPGTPLTLTASINGYVWDEEPPYEILSSRQFHYQDLIQVKAFAELLERLWNNELLNYSLSYLVEHYFKNSISLFFKELMQSQAAQIAKERMQPEGVFSHLLEFIQSYPWFENDSLLHEHLLIDYFKKFKFGSKMNPWIQNQMQEQFVLLPDGGKQKMPVLHLSAQTVFTLNQHLADPLIPGEYILKLQTFKKGNPVAFLPYEAD